MLSIRKARVFFLLGLSLFVVFPVWAMNYDCMNPKGIVPDITIIPPTERLASLDGKTIYLVDIGKPDSDILLKAVGDAIVQRFPSANTVYYPKTRGFKDNEPGAWWQEIKAKAHGVVIGPGD
jgi:hypothetical protein